MPRIAKPHTDEAQLMRRMLGEYLNQKKVSANGLSKSAKVGQWTLSRFLSGQTKTVTPAVRAALTYAGIEQNEVDKCISLSVDNLTLRKAIERHWDGTSEGAGKLALLIEAVGPLLRSMRLDKSKEISH